jgi:nuclear RNA export factor
MDSAARKTRRSTPADPSNPRSRPPTRSSNPNTRGASRTARTVLKHLGHGEPAHLASRISGAGSSRQQRSRAAQSGPLSYLRVRGLAQSKAARNPDGGLGDLLSFLERKASALTPEQQKRSVIIIKVCASPRNSWLLARYERQASLYNRYLEHGLAGS